ncbi:MAG: hypothetical protein CL678_17665 [Bdellovibrionaceae bacterium]|nr:hypothetical protein [Pseudobdellovibrionaceae bacterium]|tara:strand:+ start:418 stop:801 length:384 start_codon:yes stop_codon:yes gene_type:complete
MKLIIAIMLGALSATAFASEPLLICDIVESDQYPINLIARWKSTSQPNPFPDIKYYGEYENEHIFIKWGLNLDNVPGQTDDYFSIFSWEKCEECNGAGASIKIEEGQPVKLSYGTGGGYKVHVHCYQ